MLETAALSSGSSGNCFYIGNSREAILVDAGISSKKIVSSLAALGKSPEHIKGVFITHEHTDHIKGADVFARNFSIPIFTTKRTVESSFICSNPSLLNFIQAGEKVDIGHMKIESFAKSHKACEPLSFSITSGKKVSVLTDIGYCCNNVESAIKESDFLYLESNHDLNMLDNGPYPFFLKKWIKSEVGHLSNFQAGLAVLEFASPKLKNVVLSHLSETNNTPLAALHTFSDLAKERHDFKAKISLSLKHKPTQLFQV